ncbi:Rrf2 family transcriptional regulator [bacterium]|nr:Rrf2 family transcriptional regulator [bacterium]
MLNLTKRVDYGLIALTHLAACGSAFAGGECGGGGAAPSRQHSVREVAELYHISKPLLANVMKDMARFGFVRSVRGMRGGYELALAPESLSVGRVVEALEGPFCLTECVNDGEAHQNCSLSEVCPIKRSIFQIHMKIRDVLYGLSIADLSKNAGSKVRLSDRLPLVQAAVSESPSTKGNTGQA